MQSPFDYETNDEWLFSSIKSYSNLFMYELRHPTSCIGWINHDKICVASCDNDSSKTELLELQLPSKLLVDKDEEGLHKDRDFRVISGCSHNRRINDVSHVTESDTIVTSEFGQNCVRLWKLGNASRDTIEPLSEIKNESEDALPSKFAVRPEFKHILFGTTFSNLLLKELETQETVCSLTGVSGSIGDVQFIDQNNFVVSQHDTGETYIGDLRQKNINLQTVIPPHKEHDRISQTPSEDILKKKYYAFNCKPEYRNSDIGNKKDCDDSFNYVTKNKQSENSRMDKEFSQLECRNTKLARLCSNGNIVMYDIRLQKDSLANIDIVPSSISDWSKMTIKICPHSENLLSVSGLDGKVHVVDIANSNSTETTKMDTIFTHQGHTVCSDLQTEQVLVETHTWHSEKPNLILSAANDASLHAWEYAS